VASSILILLLSVKILPERLIMFGSDFFKWFHFVIELVRLIGKIFGNGEDEAGFEEVIAKTNGKAKKNPGATSKT